MAKFFVTFIFLAIMAVENNIICNRPYANAHPSYAINTIHNNNNNNNNNNHHKYHHNQKQQHYRHPQHTNQHHTEHRTHRKLHSEQQIRLNPHQLSAAARNRKHAEFSLDKLKSVPRLWQHLQREENMYGDEPSLDNSLSHAESVAEIPPENTIEAEEAAITHIKTDLNELVQLEEEEKQLKQQLLRSSDDNNSADENDDGDDDDDRDEELGQDIASYENKLNALQKMTAAPVPHGCPKCESTRQVEQITEEELTRLRIEFVKQQILGKLRLKERPNVSAVRLPRPLYEGTTIEHADVAKDKELDDYYARTSKKFIFLEREQNECQRLNSPAMCFSFKIDDMDVDGFDVSTAVLWIFKHKRRNEPHAYDSNSIHDSSSTLLEQQTIVVSEVQQQSEQQYLPVVKTIAIQTLDVQDEWMKIDIVWPIKRWFGNHELSHLIHISCESCEIDTMDEIISVDKDYRPFIIIDTQNRRRQPRTKRSINCTDGVTECCREKLYISFAEIGWQDWIIQPPGYDAYFCRGSCSTLASVAQSSSHHHTFVQKFISVQNRNGRKPLELIPCCTAKQYSSLQLVFMDTNNTATQKTFPNMVVESCGCR